MKFLVTAANGDIGEAIARILRERWPDATLHGTDPIDNWPAKDSFDVVHRLPRGDDPGYVTAFNALLGSIEPDAAFPASEPELFALASTLPQPSASRIIMPNPELVTRFSDKLETANWLRRNGIAAPRTLPLGEISEADLPVIIKPARGHGGRGYDIVRDGDLLRYLQITKVGNYVAQELLEPEEQEYTCVVVRLLDQLRTIVMRRQMDGSNTVRAEVVGRPDIENLLSQVATASHLDGSINIQLRVTDRGPQIFEINPRFSGTVMMRHRLGFQDVLWSLDAARGIAPPPFVAPVGARVFRLAREVVAPVTA